MMGVDKRKSDNCEDIHMLSSRSLELVEFRRQNAVDVDHVSQVLHQLQLGGIARGGILEIGLTLQAVTEHLLQSQAQLVVGGDLFVLSSIILTIIFLMYFWMVPRFLSITPAISLTVPLPRNSSWSLSPVRAGANYSMERLPKLSLTVHFSKALMPSKSLQNL